MNMPWGDLTAPCDPDIGRWDRYSSMKEDSAMKLAEKIAELVEAESQSPDIAALFASLEKINHRLEKLESAAEQVHSMVSVSSSHPSADRFAVSEALVDALFEHHSKEKACTFEPSRPCDHCSMCSSRGF
jgi:hypothetical protein